MHSHAKLAKRDFLHKVKNYLDDDIIDNFLLSMDELQKIIEDENAEKIHKKRLEEFNKLIQQNKDNITAESSLSDNERESLKSDFNNIYQHMTDKIDILFQQRSQFHKECYYLAYSIIDANPKDKKKLKEQYANELALLTKCVDFQKRILSTEKITKDDLEVGKKIENEIGNTIGKLDVLRKREKTAVERKRMWLDMMNFVSICLFVFGAAVCIAGLASLPTGAGAILVAAGVGLLVAGYAIVSSRKKAKTHLNKKEEHIRTKISLHEFHGRLLPDKEKNNVRHKPPSLKKE